MAYIKFEGQVKTSIELDGILFFMDPNEKYNIADKFKNSVLSVENVREISKEEFEGTEKKAEVKKDGK